MKKYNVILQYVIVGDCCKEIEAESEEEAKEKANLSFNNNDIDLNNCSAEVDEIYIDNEEF